MIKKYNRYCLYKNLLTIKYILMYFLFPIKKLDNLLESNNNKYFIYLKIITL